MFRGWTNLGLVIASVCAAIGATVLFNQPALLFVGLVVARVVGGERTRVLSTLSITCLFAAYTFYVTREPAIAWRDVFQVFPFGAGAILITAAISWQRRQLQQTEDRVRAAAAIVDNMPAMGWSMTADGKYTYRNRAVWEFVGGDPNHFGKEDWTKVILLIHPDDMGITAKKLNESFQTGEDFVVEHRTRRHDGTYRWFRAVARPGRDVEGNITGWFGTSVDINDHKLAEEALRQNEQHLRDLVDTIPVLIWAATPQGEPAYVNKQLQEYSGVSPEDLDSPDRSRLAEALDTTVYPGDKGLVEQGMIHSFTTGEPFAAVYRIRRHDGVFRWVDSRLAPLRDQTGSIVRWYGVIVDVDESKQAEEALRASEQQLKQLVDTMPAMVWCASPSGEPTYINKRLIDYAFVRLEDLPRSGKSAVDQAIDEAIHPDDRDSFRRDLTNFFEAGQPFSLRYRNKRFDGTYRWVDSRSEPLRDSEGRLLQWYTVITDIDDETRMQEELRAAQERLATASKAASLSELSASIAHEVNQPLASIVANSKACERWLSATPPNIPRAVANMNRIVRDAHSAADVVSRVRSLFHRRPETRRAVDINALIMEARHLLADEPAVSMIEFETELEADLPAVIVDDVQIQQVLINLMRNAVEALNEPSVRRKALRISTRRGVAGTINVCVRDHGPGIENPHLIFEAFYSTKKDGMGMGLAICRSIIDAHDGELRAENAAGGGALFTLILPASAA